MDTKAEIVNEDIARDVFYLKEEISNIKQNLQILSKNDSESPKRLANVENHLCKLFGENEKHYNIYEMTDLVVEINKSLKHLKEDFASSKSRFQVFRNTQEDVLDKSAKTNKSFDLVFQD